MISLDSIFNKRVIVFGTGEMSEFVMNNLSQNISVNYFVDNDETKWRESYCNRKILSPLTLVTEDKQNITIIVASSFYYDISNQLNEMGFLENIHYFNGNLFSNHLVKESYSQEGEDMVLRRIFENTELGFYIDIGAHHPFRFSNTYSFYKKGWRGINIDPLPNCMKQFDLFRSKDINLEIGISSNHKVMEYYMYDESALNTFNKKIDRQISYKEKKEIKVYPLQEVLSKYVEGNTIDFMSIDVEGHEKEVLKSNDWEKFRPTIILVEILNSNLNEINTNPTHRFLVENHYEIIAKTLHTHFYKDIKGDDGRRAIGSGTYG